MKISIFIYRKTSILIQALPYRQVISFNDEIHTDGNSPIRVMGDDYKLYVVKNSKAKSPPYDIINEVMAYYLLKCWWLNPPEASLFEINPDNLKPEYSNNHKPHFYQHPVFGSHWLENSTESNLYRPIDGAVEYRHLHNPNDIFMIGLFDIWIENDDRKPSNNNLLINQVFDKQHFTPIDHAFIFSGLRYEDLDPAMFMPIANENILITKFVKSLIPYKQKNDNLWHQNDRDKFYLCVENCKKHFQQIFEFLPQSWNISAAQQQSLYNFLFNEERNEKVFLDYCSKLR